MSHRIRKAVRTMVFLVATHLNIYEGFASYTCASNIIHIAYDIATWIDLENRLLLVIFDIPQIFGKYFDSFRDGNVTSVVP